MKEFLSNLTIFYVDKPQESKDFYQNLFNLSPVLSSETFVLFELSKGNKFGLWSKNTVVPASEGVTACMEFALELSSVSAVDAIFYQLKNQGLTVLQAPIQLDFGYALTVLAPDGHRLRFYYLEI